MCTTLCLVVSPVLYCGAGTECSFWAAGSDVPLAKKLSVLRKKVPTPQQRNIQDIMRWRLRVVRVKPEVTFVDPFLLNSACFFSAPISCRFFIACAGTGMFRSGNARIFVGVFKQENPTDPPFSLKLDGVEWIGGNIRNAGLMLSGFLVDQWAMTHKKNRRRLVYLNFRQDTPPPLPTAVYAPLLSLSTCDVPHALLHSVCPETPPAG